MRPVLGWQALAQWAVEPRGIKTSLKTHNTHMSQSIKL